MILYLGIMINSLRVGGVDKIVLTDEEIKAIIESIEIHLSKGLDAAHGLRYVLKMRGTIDNYNVIVALVGYYRDIWSTCTQGTDDILSGMME